VISGKHTLTRESQEAIMVGTTDIFITDGVADDDEAVRTFIF
jgi:hypothetical protein